MGPTLPYLKQSGEKFVKKNSQGIYPVTKEKILEKIGPNCSWWVEFFTNPSPKIGERQIDSSPQGVLVKIKNIWVATT